MAKTTILVALVGVAAGLGGIALNARAASLKQFPVYVVEARTDAVDVWAPDAKTATTLAAKWTRNGGPSEEYPFDGEAVPTGPGAHGYDHDARPFVRLSDRRTVAAAWYVTSTMPDHSTAAALPSYEAWKAQTDALPAAAVDPGEHGGTVVDGEVRAVNLDAPDFRPSWNPYRRYITSRTAHVWYYLAASQTAALKAADEWIGGGKYATGRRLTYSEVSDLGNFVAFHALPDPAQDGAEPPITDAERATLAALPARRWAALLATGIEPGRVRDRSAVGAWETVSDALPSQRAPYDDRLLLSGAVPYFTP